MPFEEIGEGLTRYIIPFIKWMVIDVLLDIICWSVGWIILKAVSLGRLPTKDTDRDWVAALGAVVLSLMGVVAFFYQV